MIINTFFVCPNCGNDKEFRIFTSSFRDIKQSPKLGMRIEESDSLPNLRQADTYVECKLCFQRFECDSASAVGKNISKHTTASKDKTQLSETGYPSCRRKIIPM